MQKQSIIVRMIGIKLDCIYNLRMPKIKLQGNQKGIYKIRLHLFFFFKRWKYDVFFSFKGEDTRKKFTNHPYTGLKQKKSTQVENIYCLKALESNRRIEVCYHFSIKRLCLFKVVLDLTNKDCWVHGKDKIGSSTYFSLCRSQ